MTIEEFQLTMKCMRLCSDYQLAIFIKTCTTISLEIGFHAQMSLNI